MKKIYLMHYTYVRPSKVDDFPEKDHRDPVIEVYEDEAAAEAAAMRYEDDEETRREWFADRGINTGRSYFWIEEKAVVDSEDADPAA